MISLPRSVKRLITLSVDVSLGVFTVWLAFYLHRGEWVRLEAEFLWATLVAIVLILPVFLYFGLYRSIFRYSGWPTMVLTARALAIYTFFYAGVIFVIGLGGIPQPIGLLQPLLFFVAVVASRALAGFWLGGLNLSPVQMASLPKALIYGAGNSGRQLVSALADSYEIRVVGFLDDDERLHGHVLHGQPIFAPDELGALVESKGVTHVLLAIPSAHRRRRNDIIQALSQHRVAVRTLPSFADLAQGRVTLSDLHELDMDDLLGRDAVAPNPILLAKNTRNKVVLVTGAGGSIGSELCRQIFSLRPEKLLLVEISEYALYALHAELEGLQQAQPEEQAIQIIPLLASVQDQKRMREIVQTWRPDTLYHAAAYKHVPMVEHNLTEGVRNNVMGTLHTAQVAIEAGVANFVLISTDKAVRPTNVMGASKRLAELCLQALFAQHAKNGKTKLCMVRFGNVLDSSGSVIPLFRNQVRDGGPVTLTHPEITRYFMTIPEAAQLVIQAGAMARGGDVFVLEMGEPVKIADLARRVIELSGLSVRDQQHPEGDIEIVITGLRPGEKLYEELLLGEDPQPTAHPKIQRAQDPFIPWPVLEAHLVTLQQLLGRNDVEAILSLLRQLIIGYQPSSPLVDWVFCEQTRDRKSAASNDRMSVTS